LPAAPARQLFQSGLAVAQPDQILGYPFTIHNDMPTLHNTSPISARKVVLFGNLMWRVSNLSVLRLTEKFADYGIVVPRFCPLGFHADRRPGRIR
jgi:HK97 family phage major capsid protein